MVLTGKEFTCRATELRVLENSQFRRHVLWPLNQRI
jgi:hypothetical protein